MNRKIKHFSTYEKGNMIKYKVANTETESDGKYKIIMLSNAHFIFLSLSGICLRE